MTKPEKSKSNEEDQKPLKQYLKYSTIGFQMIATILVGVFIGDWLDQKFNNTNKLYTIICSLLAIFLALYLALRDFFKST